MPVDHPPTASSVPSTPRRLLAEWLPLVAALVLLLAARDTLANHYQVPSGSMQPTLVPGDRVAVAQVWLQGCIQLHGRSIRLLFLVYLHQRLDGWHFVIL